MFSIDPSEASLTYSAAICSGQREQDSQSLLDFFESPAAQRCFRRCGLTLPETGRSKSRKRSFSVKLSTRNVLKGKVKSLLPGAVNTEVYAIIKASNVMLAVG